MSKTMRNLPEWAKRVEWTCAAHKVQNMRFSGVRCLKGNRGDGQNEGWNEYDSPKQKILGKRIARKVMRAHGNNIARKALCES